MSKEFIPFLTHSEITNEIYIVYGKDKKVCVTDQVIKAMQRTGRMEEQTAEWIIYGKQGGIPISYRCSNCDFGWENNKFKYCPNCGCRMKEVICDETKEK